MEFVKEIVKKIVKHVKYVDIAGLFMQLLAFLFATPELLGEQATFLLENWFIRFIVGLVELIIIIYVVLVPLGLIFCLIAVVDHYFKILDNIIFYYLFLGITVICFIFLMVFYSSIENKIKRWFDKISQDITPSRKCLITGAMLFFLGTVLQIFATCLQP